MSEGQNPASIGLDKLDTASLLSLMHNEDIIAVSAIKAALPMIEQAVQDAVTTIKAGGHIVYSGAGTSGRLGVLDASEISPTFGSQSFKAIIAGGPEAVTRAIEGAEDDSEEGRRQGRLLSSSDMAVGITASGQTPFVLGFLDGAQRSGARLWCISSSPPPEAVKLNGNILLDTGSELIAGSTRMKAGTAQKLALNMLSTATMIRLGGTYDDLMVDVTPTNQKLINRAEGIIMQITSCTQDAASEALRSADMSPKLAALMLKTGLDKSEALALLKRSGGSLRDAIYKC